MTDLSLRIETPRLTLRPVQPEDALPTARLVTPDVAANLSTWPSPLSPERALARIAEAQTLQDERAAIDFAILGRDDGALLGWIGLGLVEGRTARLGYWLGAQFRGRGFMKEAAAAAVTRGADFLSAKAVTALVLTQNASSIAVLESVGFTAAGTEDFYFEVAGERRACLRYIWHPSKRGFGSSTA
jgi:RimJ/RimL family protein N-acetyltransferase